MNGVSGLSASDIPALDYLSLGGGSLAGGLLIGGNSTTTGTAYYTGNVGIGTSSPTDTLSVNGPIFLADQSPSATTNRLYSNAGNLYWAGNLVGGASTGNWTSDGTNVWRVGGNVGIGTTTPWGALSVQPPDNSSAPEFVVGSSTSDSLLVTNAGFVGIGTASPGTPLEINATNGGNIVNLLTIRNSGNGAFTGEGILFGSGAAPSTRGSIWEQYSAASHHTLNFGVGSSYSTALMTILDNGNVGIGTTNPSQPLTVAGSGLFTGTLYASSSLVVGTTTPSSACVESWLPGTAAESGLYSVAPTGLLGVFFGAQTSDQTGPGHGFTSPLELLVVNDNASTTYSYNAWGEYIEGHFTALSTGTQLFGNETSLQTNTTNSAPEDPFTGNEGGWTHDLRLDCIQGNSCTNALDIVNNGATFNSGIVFGTLALSTSTAANPPALSLPAGTNGYGIDWHTAASTLGWTLFSDDTGGTGQKALDLGTNSLILRNSSGDTNLPVTVSATGGQVIVGTSAGADAGNTITLVGRSSGSSALIKSSGVDSNVALQFGTQGAGGFLFKPGNDNASAFQVQNAADTATDFLINTLTGNVGVGTTSPSSNFTFGVTGNSYLQFASTTVLTVSGESYFTGGFLALASSTIGNGTQAGGLTISGGATTTGFLTITGTTGTTSIASGQGFSVGGSQFVVQQSSGNVGIGTVAPGTNLEINTTSNYALANLLTLRNSGSGGGTGEGILFGSGAAPAIRGGIWEQYNAASHHTLNFGVGSSYSTALMTILDNGNVGIGTTSPDLLLSVGSATPVGSVAHFENSTGSCYINPTTTSLSCSSDIRLKTNVNSLPDALGLDAILQLRPVTYNWKSEAATSSPHTGFIAQEVQPVFPDLISSGPDGYLTMNYAGLTPYLVKGMQEQQGELDALLATSTASSTPESQSFASSFFSNLFARLTAWFADASNGITDLFAKNLYAVNGNFTSLSASSTISDTITANQKLCVKKSDGAPICVTGDRLAAVLASANQSPSSGGSSSASPTTDASSSTPTTPNTPPVIAINGDNPATVQVGASYNDLGATITGPQADLNLGIRTFLNGALVSNIVLDTSAVATDTIDYVATDQNGLTSTSTRTVIIQAANDNQASSTPVNDNAVATTTATSTAN